MIEQDKKYKSYKELAAAYESGELDREKDKLILDNDVTTVYVGDDAVCVFRGNGYYDIEEMAAALGIPAEWC